MNDKKGEINRYHLGEEILIGYRNDDTLFWLKPEKPNWNPDKDELNVLEAGNAWIDEKSHITILDFPISEEEKIRKVTDGFLQGVDVITPYKESDYYVKLSECPKRNPIKTEAVEDDYIDHDYDPPEHIDGYILDEDTFLRKNYKTGKLYYVKFSEYTIKDIDDDKFGWLKAAREYLSSLSDGESVSDEELLEGLIGFKKVSYGDAWIDKFNDIVVLGPERDQEVEISDNYFADRVCSYLGIYSEWNQTASWIDVESGKIKNPFNYRVNYFYLLEKYMG